MQAKSRTGKNEFLNIKDEGDLKDEVMAAMCHGDETHSSIKPKKADDEY